MFRYRRLYFFVAVAAVVFGITIGMSAGHTARAADKQTFVVQVGAQAGWNTDLLMFAPSTLQVHRGDTVTFVIGGFHNVRLAGQLNPLVIEADVNGQKVPAINPAIAFPSGTKNGEAFTGAESNSGLPGESPVYSVIVDAAPGTYAFLCDIHPGMAGNLTVVEDSAAIPSPVEVQLQGAAEIGATVGAMMEANGKVAAASMQPAADGKVMIQAGSDTGRAASLLYFPFYATIKAGDSVTFAIPKEAIEPHTVSWPPVIGQDVVPVEQKDGPPILTVGPSLAPLTQDGSTVKMGEAFSSGLMGPGQSFTLTFADPGTYPFACNIHPGMQGVIVVGSK